MISDQMLAVLEQRGLEAETVVRLGLESQRRDGGDCLVLPFVRNGEVVRRKYRTFGDDKKFWQDKGGVRCAWNEDVLRDDSLTKLPLIITEGELDALTAIQAGFPRVISVPDGAPPPGERDASTSTKYDWIAEIRPFLTRERAPEIILATDGDENGAALMQDLSVLLGRFRCKYLTYPKTKHAERYGRPRLKDLNEVLQEYGPKGVVETLNRAEWLRVDGVYRMSELPPLPPQQVFEIGFELLSENMKLRLGDFMVVTGTPGFGKSTFINDVMCRVVAQHRVRVAWASFEQAPQRDHRRALRSWFNEGPEHLLSEDQILNADAWIDRQHVFIVPSEDDDVTLDWLLDRMEVSAVQHGVQFFVIDPWNELEHSRERDETETEYIGRAIRRLKRFARAFQVHITVVAHPTKSTKDADGNYKMPTLYDIAGSANWYNKADLGVVIHRQSEDETLVKVQKSRYHEVIGRPGEVVMHYSRDTRHFIETERCL